MDAAPCFHLEPGVNATLCSFPALNDCLTSVFLTPPPELFVCLYATQDQRLKEIGVQTPPSASPSSQVMNSANNNHIAQTPELFPYSLSANRYSPSPFPALVVAPQPSSVPSLSVPPPSVPNLNSDLFDLQPAFIPTVQSTPSISTANSAWGGTHLPSHSRSNTSRGEPPPSGTRGRRPAVQHSLCVL